MLNLKTHVLRFWETEFPQLEPLRAQSRQRLYTEDDVNVLRRIQHLLREQGMTIEGAKRILSGEVIEDENVCAIDTTEPDLEFLGMIQRELKDICSLLRKGGQS